MRLRRRISERTKRGARYTSRPLYKGSCGRGGSRFLPYQHSLMLIVLQSRAPSRSSKHTRPLTIHPRCPRNIPSAITRLFPFPPSPSIRPRVVAPCRCRWLFSSARRRVSSSTIDARGMDRERACHLGTRRARRREESHHR